MTLEELLTIIKNKRENVQNDIIAQNYGNDRELSELYGTMNAYTDLIYLIYNELNKEKK